MTPAELLKLLEQRGIRASIDNGLLRFRGIKARYTDAIDKGVDEHRDALIQNWRCWSCGAITSTMYGFPPILLCTSCAPTEVAARSVATPRERPPVCSCGEVGVPPACPGCGGVAPHPPSLKHEGEPWWCLGCLNGHIWERAL